MIRLPVDDPGEPDTRSPALLLVWVGRHQLGTLALGIAFGVVWMVAQALMPFAIGRAIEDGIVDDDSQRARALGRDPPRPRRRAGRRRRDAAPVRRLELAPGLVPDGSGRRPPCRPLGPRRPRTPLDRRGRRDGLERCAAGRRRLRHHRAACRGDRRLRRGRGDPALGVGRPRPHRAARRSRARPRFGLGDPAAPGAAARAARGGRGS